MLMGGTESCVKLSLKKQFSKPNVKKDGTLGKVPAPAYLRIQAVPASHCLSPFICDMAMLSVLLGFILGDDFLCGSCHGSTSDRCLLHETDICG